MMQNNFSDFENVSQEILAANDAILTTTMVLGIVGNTLTIVTILKTKQLRSPMNISLVSLALADLFACVVVIPLRLCVYKAAMDGPRLRSICQSLVFLKSLCDYSEPCLLVATSYERYQAIAKPFESRNKQRRIIVIAVLTVLLCAGFASVSVTNFHDGALIFPCHADDEASHTLVFRETMVSLPFGICCILLVLIFYILMIKTLHVHSQTMGKKTRPLKDRLGFKNKVQPSNEATTESKETKDVPNKTKVSKGDSQNLSLIVDKGSTGLKSDTMTENPALSSHSSNVPQARSQTDLTGDIDSCTLIATEGKKDPTKTNTSTEMQTRRLSFFRTRDYIFKSKENKEASFSTPSRKVSRKHTTRSYDDRVKLSGTGDENHTLETCRNSLNNHARLLKKSNSFDPQFSSSGHQESNKYDKTEKFYNQSFKGSSSTNSSDLLTFDGSETNAQTGSINPSANKLDSSVNIQETSAGTMSESIVKEPKIRDIQYDDNMSQMSQVTDDHKVPTDQLSSDRKGIEVCVRHTAAESLVNIEVSQNSSEEPFLGSMDRRPEMCSNEQESQVNNVNVTSNNEPEKERDNHNSCLHSGDSTQETQNTNIQSTQNANIRERNVSTVNNIDIVDFDGTVHKNVLVEGPVCGAVCVMNSSNKMAGRRKVEMRAAKRIAFLIGSFASLWLLLPITSLVVSRKDYIVLKDVQTLVLTASLSSTTVIVNPFLNFLLNKQMRSAAVTWIKRLLNKFKRNI